MRGLLAAFRSSKLLAPSRMPRSTWSSGVASAGATDGLCQMDISYAAPCLRPQFIPVPKRLRGSRAAGLSFEKACERAIAKSQPALKRGQWFQYMKGSEGPHWCQPDLLLVGAKRLWVFECKLGNYLEGLAQLQDLYLPVLRTAFPDREARGVVILRHLSALPLTVTPLTTLAEAMSYSGPLPGAVLHYLGRGPL
jgi:hypothetical protein